MVVPASRKRNLTRFPAGIDKKLKGGDAIGLSEPGGLGSNTTFWKIYRVRGSLTL
jgi:hypothetical protein